MLNKIKELRRECQYYLKFSVKIKKLRKKNERIYVCVGSAVHGNMGDQALGYCRIEFLKKLGIEEKNIIEYTTRDRMRYWPQICKAHKKEDVILIRGGGYWGDLWLDGFQEILLHIEQFRDNKIIVFPQSVFFSNTKEGNEWLEKSKHVVEQCENLHIIARDMYSFEKLKKNYPNVDVGVCPDTVLSYYPDEIKKRRQLDVLLCLRNDKEKGKNVVSKDRIISILRMKSKTFFSQDTAIDFNLKDIKKRKIELNVIWEKFANSKLVITDRLHGMIFSVITETPCIVFDNIDGKVGHQYEWIKHLEYVFFVKSAEEFEQVLEQTFDLLPVKYPIEEMWVQYKKLAELIV